MASLAMRPRVLPRLFSNTTVHQATATADITGGNVDHRALPPDYQFLSNLVKTMPFVLNRPVPQMEEKYFQLPLGTWFTAPTRELGLQMKDSFAHALQEKGLAVIELGFEDPKSHFMLDLVKAIGCVPDTHSSTQGALVIFALTALSHFLCAASDINS
jgi:hypothetical protein